MEAFILDVISSISERYDEAEKESENNRKDLFNSGRALAYYEVKEIIESRLEIYDIQITKKETA